MHLHSEPLTRNATREILERIGVRPSRKLGQNFLIDPNIVRKSLALAEIQPREVVVEIGPGLGILTQALLEKGTEVFAIERDPRLFEFLSRSIGSLFPERLHLMRGDAMKAPLAGLEAHPDSRLPDTFKIVSNLPYAIATPWLERVLSGPLPKQLVLMLQKEAADRFTAESGTKTFAAITIFLQAAYNSEIGHRVSAECFFPKPAVDSVILNLRKRHEPCQFEKSIRGLIRRLFTQRRKQVANLLRNQPDGQVWLRNFEGLGIPPTSRPEQIPISAWIRAAKQLRCPMSKDSE